jgi:hypothetical protein
MKLTVENKKLNISMNVLPEKYRWRAIQYRHVVIFLGICVAIAVVLMGLQRVQEALDLTKSLGKDAVSLQESTLLKAEVIKTSALQESKIDEFEEIGNKKNVFTDEISVVVDTAIAVNMEDGIIVDIANIEHEGSTIVVHCSTDVYTDQVIYTPSMARLAEAIMETEMFYAIERAATSWELPLPALYKLEIIREKP